MNGNTFGLTFVGEDGETVQNTKLDESSNLYLIAFWLVSDKFWLTGSDLLFEVIILKVFLIFLSSVVVFVVIYSTL